MDPYLIVRTVSLYGLLMLTTGVWVWRRPQARTIAGATLATLWNLPVLVALQLVTREVYPNGDWWRFDAEGGLFLGMPVDLYLEWAWLWGGLPFLAFPTLRIWIVPLVVLGLDLLVMPMASPVLVLGDRWLVGEGLGLLAGCLPGQLLAHWTAESKHLPARATLQLIAFGGFTLLLLPAIAIEGAGIGWSNPVTWPAWRISLAVQALAVPSLIGVTAVMEFVTRGRGTPVPFDPPSRLVTTGIYAYVRNPMQLSGLLVLLVLGGLLAHPWIVAAAIMAHIYSVGLAGWDEDADLRARFGDDWTRYHTQVRRWLPRWRPWVQPDTRPARLYVSQGCDPCSQVGSWFMAHRAHGLDIVAAETHPSHSLTRMQYEGPDGHVEGGVAATARAWEHLHFGWAMAGACIRLPGVRQLAQLLVDASGGGPRTVTGGVQRRRGGVGDAASGVSHISRRGTAKS